MTDQEKAQARLCHAQALDLVKQADTIIAAMPLLGFDARTKRIVAEIKALERSIRALAE